MAFPGTALCAGQSGNVILIGEAGHGVVGLRLGRRYQRHHLGIQQFLHGAVGQAPEVVVQDHHHDPEEQRQRQ